MNNVTCTLVHKLHADFEDFSLDVYIIEDYQIPEALSGES